MVNCVQIQSVGEPRGPRGIIVAAERRTDIVRTLQRAGKQALLAPRVVKMQSYAQLILCKSVLIAYYNMTGCRGRSRAAEK